MTFVINSPLTGNADVKKVGMLTRGDIISLYKKQAGIDVTRFFVTTPVINIYECNETCYRFYHPGCIIGDEKLYEELQFKGIENKQGYYRVNQFDHKYADSEIDEGEHVLEIGCGDGSFLKSLMGKTKNITGIELNANAAQLCRKNGIEVYNELIEAHSVKRYCYYDAICCFQVLEHIYDVKVFIFNSLKALKTGGKFIISVPNNEPYFLRYNKYETFNLPPHHMGLWNEKVFKKLENLFPVELKKIIYSDSYSWKADVYYRAKNWANIKSLINQHTTWEKFRIGLLIPFSTVLTLVDKARNKIHGGQLCVLFEKK
ncbi:MAG: class I SAM-dependent methyltransferase [Bacteroidia bacterium]|nr:class I SAM-dependent methyltransferase [Bacteroidia bacterium]